MGIYNGTISGRLISRTIAKGTRSEGPEYSIIPTGEFARWKEIQVSKKVHRWQKDPILEEFVGLDAAIFGEIIETRYTISLDYIKITKI